MNEVIKLRIHHFFDILRDYGANKEMVPHQYGHSYHLIAEKIYSNDMHSIKIILACDDICTGCSMFVEGHCIDTIDHREDFSLKEDFNNHIDQRIMKTMNLEENKTVTYKELLSRAALYINEMDWIYKGNDPDHTETRKGFALKGILKKKSELDIL